MFEIEKETSIINKLVELMQTIIDKHNYKKILLTLFEKFKKS